MKLEINIKSRTVDNKLAEKEQTLYAHVVSVTVIPDGKIYFLEGGKLLSDFWLDTSDLSLLCLDGQDKMLRFVATSEWFEKKQEIPVTAKIVAEFPRFI